MDKKMYEIGKTDLAIVDVPAQTATYKPVSHKQLMDFTLEAADKEGFKIVREEYTAAKKGLEANGRYIIQSDDKDLQIMIGWQNSYNKMLSLKFAIGAEVFICSNGCVRGDMGSFKKKHWGDVQDFTPTTIAEHIKRAGDVLRQIQVDRDRMKEIELSKRVIGELVGRMYIENSLITSDQLSILKGEIESPTHIYHSTSLGTDRSMWDLYNYTTFALKETHPAKYFKQHMDVHDFFTQNMS